MRRSLIMELVISFILILICGTDTFASVDNNNSCDEALTRSFGSYYSATLNSDDDPDDYYYYSTLNKGTVRLEVINSFPSAVDFSYIVFQGGCTGGAMVSQGTIAAGIDFSRNISANLCPLSPIYIVFSYVGQESGDHDFSYNVSFTSNGEDCSVNEPPTILMTAPTSTQNVVPGDFVYFVWDGNDPNEEALVAVALDNDRDWDNGIYEWLFYNRPEDGSMNWEVPDLPEGTYYLVTQINDGEYEDFDYADGAIVVGSSSNGDGTEIPGATITTNAVWGIDGNPYIVTGKVYIQSGVSLTIESGVYIDFGTAHIELGVFVLQGGTLAADGVTFDGTQVASANTWAAIEVQEASTLSLKNCHFSSHWTAPSSGGEDWRGTHITGNNAQSIEISNCTFNGMAIGISLGRQSHMDVSNSTFTYCNTGISIQYGTANITGCTFDEIYSNCISLSGGPQYSGAKAEISGCRFINSPEANGIRGLHDASAEISACCFSNLNYAVNNGSSNQSLAKNNWWNSETGPTYADNPGGSGEAILGDVDYNPWIVDGCGGTGTSGESNIFYNIWLVDENGVKTPAIGKLTILSTILDNLAWHTLMGFNTFYYPSYDQGIYEAIDNLNLVMEEWQVDNGVTRFDSDAIKGDLVAYYENNPLLEPRELLNDEVYYVIFRFLNTNNEPSICWWTLNYSQFKGDNGIPHVQDIFIYPDRPAWTERYYQGENIVEGKYEDGYIEGYKECQVSWVTHPIQEQQNAAKPILFVHGIESKDNAFGDLPVLVQLDNGDRDVWQFNYDGKDAMEEVSLLLDSAVEYILGKYDNQSKIDVVAHSYGNLVCRQYIQNKREDNRINRLLMITPPNHGSQSAVAVNDISEPCDVVQYFGARLFLDRDYNAPIYEELDPASPSLLNLPELESQNGFYGTMSIVLAGTENMVIPCHDEANQHQDGVVSISSASMVDDNIPLYLIDIYHTELDEPYNDIYDDNHSLAVKELINDFFDEDVISTAALNQRILSEHAADQVYEPIDFILDPTDNTLESDDRTWTESSLPYEVNKIDTWNSDEVEINRGGIIFKLPDNLEQNLRPIYSEYKSNAPHKSYINYNSGYHYLYSYGTNMNGLAIKLNYESIETDIPLYYPDPFYFGGNLYKYELLGHVFGKPLRTELSRFEDCRESEKVYVDLLCPASLLIIAPFGDTISIDNNGLGNAHYLTWYDSLQNEQYDQVVMVNPEKGFYNIKVIPDTGFSPEDVYTLIVSQGDIVNVIADSVLISNIPSEGYTISTLDTGSIAGVVESSTTGLFGIPVDLYDSLGTIIASTVTDDSGYYQFPELDNGSYSVTISTPLGYQAGEETKEIEVRGLPHEVNFELTPLEITPQQRSRGYWAHQLHKALQNKPKDYTSGDFADLTGLINIHFNNNQINSVDFYSVPQPANRADSLDLLQDLLHMRNTGEWQPFLKRLANSQLMALMLNVVSGKVSQTHRITSDGLTISQAITYCDMLVNDEIDPPDEGPGHGSQWCRYIRASYILVKANLGIEIESGIIPPDVIEIAYRIHNKEILPQGFELGQNYPNPFNPKTNIDFTLPKRADVKLDIYNIMGQKVATVADASYEAGDHAVTWDGSKSASGVYFYKLTAGEFEQTRKMLLLK